MENINTYSKKERNMFLTGMFGQNMIYNVVAVGLYYYFQNVICLPAIALGWIFAIARIWDAINDPMMGSIVDKTRTKWGKCRPYLIFSPIVICVITIAAFFNGNYANAKANGNKTAMIFIVAWAAISYVLWGMSYTVGDIPLWGIISRITESEKDRSSLISLSRIIASIGAGLVVISIVAVSQSLNSAFGLDTNAQKGFIVAAIIITIIGSALFECAGIGTKERVPNGSETKKVYNLFSGLSAVAFVLLFVVYLIAPTDLSKIGFVVIDGILFFGTGMGFGGVNVCQSVMISDCIDYEEYHHGYRPDGIFFSGQSFITKFSAGISSIISGYVFDAVGYTDININKMNEAIANGANFATDYTSYSKAMWFLISIPPAIGMILAVIPTLKYEIDKKSHNKMLEELVKRHKQNNQGDTNG